MPAIARILAIDDQPYFRRFLQGLLGEEGYEVVLGRRDELDLRLRANGPFDVALIDGHDETELERAVEAVRAHHAATAVIVLCGEADVRSAILAMRVGAADVLLKPVDRGRLLESITGAIGARRPERGDASGAASAPQARELERLVDENLRFMGRLSLLERIVPLLATLDMRAVAAGFLEMLCVEVAASSGELWLRRAPGRSLERLAAWGRAQTSAAQPSEAVIRTLESGRAGTALGDSEEAALLLPLLHARRLLGVVRIYGGPRSPFGNRDLESCAELADWAAAALANALRLRELEGERLRDPDTQLPTRGFFDHALEIEIQKAHRFGRRLCSICIDLHELRPEADREAIEQAVHAMSRTLRTTDLLCSDGMRFWVLITDTDPLGGVVLKRRLADRVREAIAATGRRPAVTLGVSSYPLDGESRDALVSIACARSQFEQQSVVHALGFREDAPLSALGQRLLRQASSVPESALAEIAEFLIGELTARPHDSGLLFLAPGDDPAPVMAPLMSLGDTETAMEVFLATDGDTVPACPSLTAVALPPNFDTRTTWIVRFGEGPPYALVAGPPKGDGTRPMYHSSDPVLVEQMTFRLCSELGVGLRS